MHRFDWRGLLARLPLPMLALAASYGVYTFNALFVPAWVAFVSACAFELTYVGLAVAQIEVTQRRRAALIAASAVAVSVVYNVASGLFHRRPELLTDAPLWADALLAVLHGLPLAIVAYNVASLLLHQEVEAPVVRAAALAQAQPTAKTAYETVRILPSANGSSAYACPSCGAALTMGQYAASRRYGHCRQCKDNAR